MKAHPIVKAGILILAIIAAVAGGQPVAAPADAPSNSSSAPVTTTTPVVSGNVVVYPSTDNWNDAIGGATIGVAGASAIGFVVAFFIVDEKYKSFILAGLVTSFFAVLSPFSVMFTNDISNMMGVELHKVLDYTVVPPVETTDYFPWFILVFFALARPVTFYGLQSLLTVGLTKKSTGELRDATLPQRFVGGLLFSAAFLVIFYGAGAGNMTIRSVFMALGLALVVGLVIYQFTLGLRVKWEKSRWALFALYVLVVLTHAVYVIIGSTWLGVLKFKETVIFGFVLIMITDAVFPWVVFIIARITESGPSSILPNRKTGALNDMVGSSSSMGAPLITTQEKDV